MNQKQIGIILLIIAVLLGSFVYLVDVRESAYIQSYFEEEGTC